MIGFTASLTFTLGNDIANSGPGHLQLLRYLSDGMPEFMGPYNHAPCKLTQLSLLTHYGSKQVYDVQAFVPSLT